MILARRATLRPSIEQAAALGRACGTARWAWNWGLAKKRDAWKLRKEALDAGVEKSLAPKVPTAIDLHRELNQLKRLDVEVGGVPWMYQSTKCAPQEALRDLDAAFDHFFRRVKEGETPGYPRFKSRGRSPGHFRVSSAVKVSGGRIHLPRIGSVRFMPGDRGYIPDGTYATASVVEDHGRWCVSVRIETPEAVIDDSRPVVGLDAGVRDLAHLSDGTIFPNPRALERESSRLRKVRLSIARKQRAADKCLGKRVMGQHREESKRLQHVRRQAARLAHRVARIRKDALHKVTTTLAKAYHVVVVEALNSRGMTRSSKGRGRAAKAGLNRAILDSGMLRLRPLLAYKMPLYGGQLIEVPAAYTSKTCSSCKGRNDPGSSKIYRCAYCGVVLDRDHNASLNILAAASCTAVSTGFSLETSRGAAVRPKAQAGRQAALIRQSEVITGGQA